MPSTELEHEIEGRGGSLHFPRQGHSNEVPIIFVRLTTTPCVRVTVIWLPGNTDVVFVVRIVAFLFEVSERLRVAQRDFTFGATEQHVRLRNSFYGTLAAYYYILFAGKCDLPMLCTTTPSLAWAQP